MCGIARALTARGVKTARGGDWSDVQVAAILRCLRRNRRMTSQTPAHSRCHLALRRTLARFQLHMLSLLHRSKGGSRLGTLREPFLLLGNDRLSSRRSAEDFDDAFTGMDRNPP